MTNFIVGDWSGDGHNITDTFVASLVGADAHHYLNPKIQKDLIKQAFKAGVDSGLPDITKTCEDYEDNLVPRIFKDSFPDVEFDNGYDEGSHLCISSEEYFEIYLRTVNAGLKVLGVNALFQKDDAAKVEIGGYGLFYS